MPSLQPLVYHISNALSGYFCDGLVQGFLVGLGIADELSLALVRVFVLGLGLEEYRQGEGCAVEFDEVRAGHGGGVEFGVLIVAQKQNPATWGRAGLKSYVPLSFRYIVFCSGVKSFQAIGSNPFGGASVVAGFCSLNPKSWFNVSSSFF
jgi:hypothetical protein